MGYEITDTTFNNLPLKNKDISSVYDKLGISQSTRTIIIAPFSYQKSKQYFLDRIEEIINHFDQNENINILIFGGGRKDKLAADEWHNKYNKVTSVVDRLSFYEESLILAQSSLVLTLDSSNLHLSNLVGTKVISIWGTTTPNVGFYPENLSKDGLL